jgi:hypothetical protein
MRTDPHTRRSLLDPTSRPPIQTKLTLGSRWQGPTLKEFCDRVEHEFGASTAIMGLPIAPGGGDESLAPADVRLLCDQLGIPPEDFGVEP